MSLTQKYKGEPITFSIELFNDAEETQAVDLTTFDDVIVYVYVDKMDKKKFARIKANYTRYENTSTNFKLDGTVPGSVSKTMFAGIVKLEIWTAVNGKEQLIVKMDGSDDDHPALYELIDSQIKAES